MAALSKSGPSCEVTQLSPSLLQVVRAKSQSVIFFPLHTSKTAFLSAASMGDVVLQGRNEEGDCVYLWRKSWRVDADG